MIPYHNADVPGAKVARTEARVLIKAEGRILGLQKRLLGEGVIEEGLTFSKEDGIKI